MICWCVIRLKIFLKLNKMPRDESYTRRTLVTLTLTFKSHFYIKKTLVSTKIKWLAKKCLIRKITIFYRNFLILIY